MIALIFRIVSAILVVVIAVLQFTTIFQNPYGRLIVLTAAGAAVVCIVLAEVFTIRDQKRRDKRQDDIYIKMEALFGQIGKQPVSVVAAGEVIAQRKPDVSPTGSITGAVDLLAIRLDLSDLHIRANWTFTADFGVFVRMWVTATDKPRTIRNFVIEVATVKGGEREETFCTAESEREIGDYRYKYRIQTTDTFGYIVEDTKEEEMPNLIKKLRNPVSPGTDVEGWVRFELKDIHYDLATCSIAIYAVDPEGGRHEIETARMKVMDVQDDRAYVVSTRR